MKRSSAYFLGVGFLTVVFLLIFLTRHSPKNDTSQRPSDNSSLNSNTSQSGISSQSLQANVSPSNPPPTQSNATPSVAANATSLKKRSWDTNFLVNLRNANKAEPIQFELVAGRQAVGSIEYVERRNGELIYISGKLTQPEAGTFFFQKQTQPGLAGDFVGVVEFPASKTAYRIEPTGPNGAPELVKRPLDQVVCMNLPPPDTADTNDVEEAPPLYPNDFPTTSIPEYQHGIIRLESLAGVSQVIYLDFQAGYTPTWGGITYSSFNFNNGKIADIWRRVAEDYIPFNINVTTDLKVYQAAPEISRQRVIFTPTTTAAPGAGGVAFFNAWNWSGDTPCWVFNSGTKGAAEAASHEVGHTLNLSHDGKTDGTTYYTGQGSGATGWAPIMGTGYTRNVVQFSKGEYANANNSQNDLNVITTQNNGVTYRADDAGDTFASSRYLEIFPDNSVFVEGVIERAADCDAFRFTTTGGMTSLQANPTRGNDWANLAVMATLTDSNNVVIATDNPQNVLSASITTNLPAGTYTFRVTGVGRNDPVSNGFSDYASLGYYSISGTVAGARLPSRFAIPENSANGTLVGVVGANNPGGDPLTYTITSGNTGGTFALNNSGNLTVANNSLLNYETLAANTQLPVQFEFFLNITNTVNSALTELNRRVVVAITDVNEAPTITGFSTTVLEHSLVGTYIGSVSSSDPDFFTRVGHSITAGNTGGMFSIDHDTGAIQVAGDLSAAMQTIYALNVTASDEDPVSPLTANTTVTVTVLTNGSNLQPGAIPYAVYTGISGNLVSSLTNAPTFPTDPASEKWMDLFEGDQNWNDNYGAVLRGYLIPPTNGNYRFWISSDDNSELWLSTTTNPANKTLIASVNGSGNATNPRQWNKYATQRSGLQSLIAGQAYYIEARMKEGSVNDNVAVAWSGPAAPWETDVATNVISAQFVAPFRLNYVPHFTSSPHELRRDAGTGALFNIIHVSDINTNDTHMFDIVSGNTDGLFAINPTTGTLQVTDGNLLQTTMHTNYALQVRITDNGAPPLSSINTVAINIVDTNLVAITTAFFDAGFEDDTPGSNPNTPAIGGWSLPSQSIAGVTIGNDVSLPPFSGNNYLKIQRTDGGESSARIDAIIGTVPIGSTVIASFAFMYESTGDTESSIQLYSGNQTRRVSVYASPDLTGSPYFTPTNFYTYNGDISILVNSSLPVTPGAWQTMKIEYTSGSTNLILTVNGVQETLFGAVTPGTVDRIRFNTGNTNSIFYIDGDVLIQTTTEVVPASVLFHDDFQSDTAGTSVTTDDLDPIIGLGDVGGTWDIRDGSTANAVPLAVQVLNDAVPNSHNTGTAGTNNYLRIYRGGGVGLTGKPYATGWNFADTTDRVIQLDMRVWQEQLPSSVGAGVMSVMFGGAPQNNPSQSDWLNTVGAWIQFEATNDATRNPKLWDLPDNQWIPVRIKANLSATTTQQGLAPQTYSVSINNGPPGFGNFWTPQNTVQSILVGWEGSNEHFDFIDDVTIQIAPEPLTVSIAMLSDNNPELTFTGNPGSKYVVQAATNLLDWVPVSTNSADVIGKFNFVDRMATNYSRRFYRGLAQ